jgi:hypothetical protein
MPAISETAAKHNKLKSQLIILQKRRERIVFASGYGGAAMEHIPLMKGSLSRDEKKTFPTGGRRNDLRLKCGTH